MEPEAPSTAETRLRREGASTETSGDPTGRPLENLIVIGASAGGQQVIEQILRGLSEDLPAAVIIMLHAPSRRASATAPFHLNEHLQKYTSVPIVEICSSTLLRQGIVYIVPPGQSLTVTGQTMLLVPYDRKGGPNTTINLLFESAADAYGDRVIGVIVSGLLKDGTEGLKAVHEAGGLTIVEDPAGAAYPSMPHSAMQEVPVTFCLAMPEIGPALDLLARRSTTFETSFEACLRMLQERVRLLQRLLSQSQNNPSTAGFISLQMTNLDQDVRVTQRRLHQMINKRLAGRGSRPSVDER
jgi:chemotaxis response regulator CheB